MRTGTRTWKMQKRYFFGKLCVCSKMDTPRKRVKVDLFRTYILSLSSKTYISSLPSKTHKLSLSSNHNPKENLDRLAYTDYIWTVQKSSEKTSSICSYRNFFMAESYVTEIPATLHHTLAKVQKLIKNMCA